MKAQLIKHLQYNLWANKIVLDLCKTLSSAQLKEISIGSFPSIEKTWLHIWDAQAIWLTRLHHEPITSWPSANFSGEIKVLNQGIIISSEELISEINAMESFLSEAKIKYKNNAGVDFESSISDVIFHIVNHSTFHRGQIINMLRGQGVGSIESTDMITFFRL